jgi:anti-sigma regulatory factor (Ser/Thr protein kinase)
MRSVTFSIPNEYSHVALVTRCIVTLASHITGQESGIFETAIGEALNNVIEHSYGDTSEERIAVELRFDAHSAHVVIEDTGRGMDPELFERSPAAFDLPETVDLLPEGGMGITIIKLACDSVSYRRERGVNRLTLVRHRRPDAGAAGDARA